MFQPVSSKVSFPQMEEAILRLWRERDIFPKSVQQRPEDRLFIFYEGPPYANASPGVHHVLSRIYKDVMVRYKTMRGFRVPRKAGWDTHGLPAELEVERALGFKSKADIEAFGIEEFNRRCRENVFAYLKEWEALTERIAFWLDLEDAYVTCHNDYIETCWWAVKQLWDRGLVYQDYRVTPHCPRCGTSLSDHEVAQGYQEDTPDPSVYIKFRLTEESQAKLGRHVPGDAPTYFLAWTTTPWTLPGNTALAVDPEAEYAVVAVGGERLILASALVGVSLDDEHRVLGRVEGRELAGLHYEPLYKPEEDWGVEAMAFRPWELSLAPPEVLQKEIDLGEHRVLSPIKPGHPNYPARRVIAADFVSLTEGTGIVHMAPAFGAEDFDAGKAEDLLFVQPVDLRGNMTAPGTSFDGLFVKDADGPVLDDLKARGLLLRRETIHHTYPFCWRCDTPLLYYAKPTWYIRTTAVKERLVALNQEINWYPAHIREGRFGNWLENNIDWAASRERFWGIPIPIWRCEECGGDHCIGSLAELRELAIDKDAAARLDDLHRPYVDMIAIRDPGHVLDEVHDKWVVCGGTAHRVPEVLDVWFDSGAMPYAQWHYPFENAETFRKSFPADFISEAVDQTRGWFYTLHALSTLLNYANPELVPSGICFRNVICLELILDAKGEKMSKSRGNVVEPWAVINAHGADALRWYLFTASPPGTARRFSTDLVGEALRKFLLTLWNTYSFFVTYALIDRFDPRTLAIGERSDLDRWVLSELNALVDRATRYMDDYNPTEAGRAIQAFVDDLSNWYVRHNRRRFWKSENDADKLAAHQTLYTCLVTVAKLLAPFAPFVAEEMYQNLVRLAFPEEPESVHLAEWPAVDPSLIDEQLMEDQRVAMRFSTLILSARSKAKIPVRQPLRMAHFQAGDEREKRSLERVVHTVNANTNVQSHDFDDLAKWVTLPDISVAEDAGSGVALETQITPELRDQGLAREIVHRLQTMRKNAGFDIADYITTHYQGDAQITRVLRQFEGYVRQETLSRELVEGPPPEGAYVEEHKLGDQTVRLAVKRLPTGG